MARGGGSNPLLNPNAPLSGKALLHAAKALVHSQTRGPMRELAHQIAVNQRQGQGAQQRTSGYFNQLGGYAHQGFQDVSQAASDLNSQLSGIGQHTQQSLQGLGQNAQTSLNQYTPGLQGSGTQALAEEIARQQGFAAQSSGAFQAAGALQGANQRGLAGTNEGVYGLMGQERLGQIAQATALSNEPLNSKIAALRASEGDLLAKNEGALRQQEITNQITQQGLGLKSQALQVTAANDAAKIKATLTAGERAQRNADRTYQLNVKRLGQQQANTVYDRTHHVGKYRIPAGSRTTGPGGLPKVTPTGQPTLSSFQQQRSFSDLNKLPNLIHSMQQPLNAAQSKALGLPQGTRLSESRIRQILGQRYDPRLVDAGYALAGWGYLTPKQITELNKMGLIVGNRYKRGRAPRPGPTISGSTSVGGAVTG